MDLFEALREYQGRGEAVALCTVVRTQGSVPRRAGAKMLVRADGGIDGTIGGGEMESRTIQAALEALQSGEASVVRFELQDPTQREALGSTLARLDAENSGQPLVFQSQPGTAFAKVQDLMRLLEDVGVEDYRLDLNAAE